MTPLVTPTVHLNGTSKQELVDQRIAVVDAARALLEAMKAAAPNARDYYTQGHQAYADARTAWEVRMKFVEQLEDEVMRDALKIALEGL